jgi:hypothetical protein
MVNCTLPLLLYKKCLSGLPGTMSVHLGRPCLTASRILSMEPFLCNCCVLLVMKSALFYDHAPCVTNEALQGFNGPVSRHDSFEQDGVLEGSSVRLIRGRAARRRIGNRTLSIPTDRPRRCKRARTKMRRPRDNRDFVTGQGNRVCGVVHGQESKRGRKRESRSP